jgi:hypothetical protein
VEQLIAAQASALGLREPERWRIGAKRLLDWLHCFDGATYQSRSEASGAESLDRWTSAVGLHRDYEHYAVMRVLQSLLCHRLVRPGYPWLIRQRLPSLATEMAATTDRQDFDQLFETARATGTTAMRSRSRS